MPERKIVGSVGIVYYYECKNLGCKNIVQEGALFCCFSCANAYHGSYEIDMHSALCDKRQIEYKKILGIP